MTEATDRSLYPDLCLECPVLLQEDYGAMRGCCAECVGRSLHGVELASNETSAELENRPHG